MRRHAELRDASDHASLTRLGLSGDVLGEPLEPGVVERDDVASEPLKILRVTTR
ncbi:MAG: hypothetical protein ABIP36_05855 [Acidimicrobiales bacterium]